MLIGFDVPYVKAHYAGYRKELMRSFLCVVQENLSATFYDSMTENIPVTARTMPSDLAEQTAVHIEGPSKELLLHLTVFAGIVSLPMISLSHYLDNIYIDEFISRRRSLL